MKNKLIVLLACLSLFAAGSVYGAGAIRVPQGNVTLDNGYLDLSPTGKGVIFPDGTVQSTASNGSGVTTITGSDPLSNTGTATNPVISLTGTVPDAKLSNNVDLLNTSQTISGQKTFSSPIISTVTTGAAPMTVSSTTQVSNLNAEMVGGNKLTDLDLRYRLPTQLAVKATTSFPAGNNPVDIAFDGTNVWTANKNSNNVTKLLASTGATVGAYSVGSKPSGITFDGTNIWVANSGSVVLTKLRASDGGLVSSYGVGNSPTGITFDGTNIWVTNQGDNTVTKMKASDGGYVGTYNVGGSPTGISFDGTNIWVTNQSDKTVTKLLSDTGAFVGTYNVGTSPTGITFDGTNIWVTNQGDNTVTKLLASTGATVGTYGVGTNPTGIIFDGINVWVTNLNSNNVTILLASTGTIVGSYSAGNTPYGIVSDGTSIWVTNQNSNTVSKLTIGMYAAIATSSITSSQLASGSVTNTQLASGSVTSANISGPLSISVGGTSATTAAGARANLGAAASGANSDITSLSTLATPLSISQGGTGSVTQNYVDLSSVQSIAGGKTFTNALTASAGLRIKPGIGGGIPADGMILKAVNHASQTAGSVVASTDNMTLQRDGTPGGWRISAVYTDSTITCTGINSLGAFVSYAKSGLVSMNQVFTNAQDVTYFTCLFGNPVGGAHETEITLHRYAGDTSWQGFMRSTFDQ